MNGYFVLDVLEISLLKLSTNKTLVYVKPVEILGALKRTNPFAYQKETATHVKRVLKELFPAYKNPRARTKVFKVRWKEAEKFLQKNKVNMRPIEDARKSRRMLLCYEPE